MNASHLPRALLLGGAAAILAGARAIGLEVPKSILLRADKVIE